MTAGNKNIFAIIYSIFYNDNNKTKIFFSCILPFILFNVLFANKQRFMMQIKQHIIFDAMIIA